MKSDRKVEGEATQGRSTPNPPATITSGPRTERTGTNGEVAGGEGTCTVVIHFVPGGQFPCTLPAEHDGEHLWERITWKRTAWTLADEAEDAKLTAAKEGRRR